MVVLALLVLPSLYAWFNVVSFWNPYDNTGNLRVCVVNEDAGAENELLGSLNVGDQVVEQLRENTQLGWAFTDYETAMDEVRAGSAYAAFVIPEDFSADLLTVLSGDFTQPNLQYYVNEKVNPVSPKITDAGSASLDETINGQFVATASKAVVDTLNDKLTDAGVKVNEAGAGVLNELGRAEATIADVRGLVAELSASAAGVQDKASDAKGSLQAARDDAAALEDALQRVSDLSDGMQGGLLSFSSQVAPALNNGTILLSQVLLQATGNVSDASAAVKGATGSVDAALGSAQSALDANDVIIAELQKLLEGMSESDAGYVELQQVIDSLSKTNEELRQSVADLQRVSADTRAVADSVEQAADTVGSAVQGATDAATAYQSNLFGDLLPRLTTDVSKVGSSAQNLKAAISNQNYLIDQTAAVLEQLFSTLGTTVSALGQTDALLANLESDIAAARTDATALGAAEALSRLTDGTRIDSQKVAEFMTAPAQVSTEKLYPLNAYGSAMAPLFMNLSLWVGAVMLCVILRLGVDRENISNLTVLQGFMGRWLLLALFAVLQAIVCCAGCLVIGVQCVSLPAFFFASIVISLTYLTVVYSLSVLLQHIGIGLCIIMVFIQIPGATGLYPVEMTSEFFQAIYPLFPFTYGINALRETIAGFYGSTYASCIGMLAACMVITGVVALFMRPYMTNLNRMVARQIEESDLLNGERPEVPPRRYRMGQLIRALSNRGEFREVMQRQAERFLRAYPAIKRGALVVGIAVPVVFTLVFAVTEGEKVVMLTAWLVWLVLIIVFMLVVEYVRDNIVHKGVLDAMSDTELRGLLSERGVSAVRGLVRDVAIGEATASKGAASGEESREAKGEHDA